VCGIVGFTGGKRPSLLRQMCRALIHRGPDDEGYFEDDMISFGMRRLAIVDIESGTQPLSNETEEIWTVCNGEIYNHRTLRQHLTELGHHFTTDHSDTEVIVHLYEEYGECWPSKVNGMFGIALWDTREKKLLLYRDRIGKKPLYYALTDQQLIFGSEIKALLKHPDLSSHLDFQALYHYFGMKHISAPHTAYTSIKQLLPGQMLIWQEGEVQFTTYWLVDFSTTVTDITEEEAAHHLLRLFEDAVILRMQCDVPYGAYLSGGVDSSAVVAMMSRHQSKPVKTFCLGYEDIPEGQFWGKAQDLAYAREISRMLGTEHHEYIINEKQFAEHMPEVLNAFDEPFSGTVSTLFLSILIHQHVKVALSGDGADELFGSYLAHRLAFPIEYYLRLPANKKEHWQELTEDDKKSLYPFDTLEQFHFLTSIASPEISSWRNQLCVFSEGERGALLSPQFLHLTGYPALKNIYRTLEQGLTAHDMLNKSLVIDQKELLPNQVLPFVDRLSMAYSIEVRAPYLDYRIIEFANTLPGSFKIKNGMVKYLHKKAMEEVLPQAFTRRSKEGFVQPIYSWMQGGLQQWTLGMLDSLPFDLFNREYVGTLKERLHSGDESVNAKVWNLVCFSVWFNEVR